jgi:excisionase family DNA binding protein
MTTTASAPACRWLTVAEAAEHRGVLPRTIRVWIRQGLLPAYRVGPRRIQISLGDLDGLDGRMRIRAREDLRLAVITTRLRELIAATEEQLGQLHGWLFDLEDDHGPPGRNAKATRPPAPSRPHVSSSPLQQGCAAASVAPRAVRAGQVR